MKNIDELLDFPCQFPIKVMGKNNQEFYTNITTLISRHVNNLSASSISSATSRNNIYLSITITITATSKQQLDNIYQELSAHPDVLWAL